MNAQTSLDFTGRQNRDAGMKKAGDHADRVHEDWKERAYRLLKWYINSGSANKTFLAEDFRAVVKDLLPEPPHKRAFGPVFARAAREGLIVKVGYASVKNPNANCANAALWRKR